MPDSRFEIALDLRVAEVLERCTSCGACVEVCPMPAAAGIDASDPQAIAGGVLSILRGDATTPRPRRAGPRCAPAAGIASRPAGTGSIRASC